MLRPGGELALVGISANETHCRLDVGWSLHTGRAHGVVVTS